METIDNLPWHMQEATDAVLRGRINRYIGNLAPMPGVLQIIRLR
jgi:hypothetical protein